MTMGDDTIQGIKDMIVVCSSPASYPMFLLIKCHNVRNSAAKSVCPSMPGHQAMDMHFSQLLCITLTMNGSLVRES